MWVYRTLARASCSKAGVCGEPEREGRPTRRYFCTGHGTVDVQLTPDMHRHREALKTLCACSAWATSQHALVNIRGRGSHHVLVLPLCHLVHLHRVGMHFSGDEKRMGTRPRFAQLHLLHPYCTRNPSLSLVGLKCHPPARHYTVDTRTTPYQH